MKSLEQFTDRFGETTFKKLPKMDYDLPIKKEII
jgi:hypothetical protein